MFYNALQNFFKIRIFMKRYVVVFYGKTIKLRKIKTTKLSRNHPIYLSCSFHQIHSWSSNSKTTKVYSRLNVTASYKFLSNFLIFFLLKRSISIVIVRVCLNNKNSTFCLLLLFLFSSLFLA